MSGYSALKRGSAGVSHSCAMTGCTPTTTVPLTRELAALTCSSATASWSSAGRQASRYAAPPAVSARPCAWRSNSVSSSSRSSDWISLATAAGLTPKRRAAAEKLDASAAATK